MKIEIIIPKPDDLTQIINLPIKNPAGDIIGSVLKIISLQNKTICVEAEINSACTELIEKIQCGGVNITMGFKLGELK